MAVLVKSQKLSRVGLVSTWIEDCCKLFHFGATKALCLFKDIDRAVVDIYKYCI